MKDGARIRSRSMGGGPETEPKVRSKRGIYWILGGLIITGMLAGYNWLRRLPGD